METHKNCGGEIVSELWASDADNDYYMPVCMKCQRSVETREVLFEREEEKRQTA